MAGQRCCFARSSSLAERPRIHAIYEMASGTRSVLRSTSTADVNHFHQRPAATRQSGLPALPGFLLSIALVSIPATRGFSAGTNLAPVADTMIMEIAPTNNAGG